MTALLLLTSIGVLGEQNYGAVSTLDWLALAYAIVGPLVLTNILWFKAIPDVGPSRATLFANLQPFVAVLFAVVLLSESLTAAPGRRRRADRRRDRRSAVSASGSREPVPSRAE